LNPDDYLVVYIGGFSLNRMLLPLIDAVTGLPDVHLILWGDGHQKAAIQEAIRNIPNARYLGWASANNVPLFTSMADVIYYCLKPDYPFSSPNTLSNAMLAGRPILVTRVGDLEQIVEETGCGIILNEATSKSIHNALEILRDPSLRQKLGQAGRKAAEKQYNWENESQKLLAIYESLN
jgi:glycosyltransferase involved in cell wall biosynthesis